MLKSSCKSSWPRTSKKHIAWDTLTPYDTSLIGQRDKRLYADLVYKALTKDHGAEMFLILNHEREPDELLPIRTLEYILGTLRKAVKQKQGKPAFIIQLTLYNGPKHPYPYARSVFDYFEHRELARKILLDAHRVIDLHDYPDDVLASHKQLNVLELKNMLQDKLPTEQISKWTGLSVGQIEALSL